MKANILIPIIALATTRFETITIKTMEARATTLTTGYQYTETEISDISNAVIFKPNFTHNYGYNDETILLRFDFDEEPIVVKEIKSASDLTFTINYDTFIKAKTFRFDLLNNETLIPGLQHSIEHVDLDQEQIVLGLNGVNSSVVEPKKITYRGGSHIISEWYRCEFQNRNATNIYSTLIETNINFNCDTELSIENLEYDYGSYQLKDLKGKLEDGKVLTGEPISFNKVVTKGIESKLYTDSHIIVDPYAINQSVQVIAEFEMGKVFKKPIKVYSTSTFENALVGHSTKSNYSFKSNESIEQKWDEEFYFGPNTIDSIIGNGVSYENIYNHKV